MNVAVVLGEVPTVSRHATVPFVREIASPVPKPVLMVATVAEMVR